MIEKKYILVFIVLFLLLGIFFVFFNKNEENKNYAEEKDKKANIPFTERNTSKTDSNLLELNSKQYYLFDSNLLLPLTNDIWTLHETNKDLKNEHINEFYIKDENNQNWTQKFIVKKINSKDELKDAVKFSEVLINGVLFSLSENFKEKNIELNDNYIIVNFVKKDTNNTIFYWELKNIPNQEDQIQFTRIFKNDKNDFYAVYFTLKTNSDTLGKEKIELFLKQLNSIINLKERES